MQKMKKNDIIIIENLIWSIILNELLQINNHIYISHQQILISEIFCINYNDLQKEYFRIK